MRECHNCVTGVFHRDNFDAVIGITKEKQKFANKVTNIFL